MKGGYSLKNMIAPCPFCNFSFVILRYSDL